MLTPTGLIRRSGLETSDPNQVRAMLDQMYDVGSRFAAPPETHWRTTISQIDADDFTTADLRLPGVIALKTHSEDHVVFCTMVRGRSEIERGPDIDRYQTGDTVISVKPHAEWRSVSYHISASTVTLPVSLLTATAHDPDDASSDTWDFSAFGAAAGRNRAWRQATRFAGDLLTDPEAVSPLTVGAVGRLLAATALSTFPNTAVTGTTIEDRRDAHPETLRRAISFIEANPDLDITLRDIARAASVTPRTIQLAFRRHLDTTPMAFLRRVRLELAHRDLQAAVPGDGRTVTLIAARWGYVPPSRFTADYRAAYGELPHVTLRRAAG